MKIKNSPNHHSNTFLILMLSIIILGFSVIPLVNYFRGVDHTKDYGKLYSVGQVVLRDGELYVKRNDNRFSYMYPPTAAVLLAPTSSFGLLPFIIILSVINAAALTASVLLSLYLATGSLFRQHPLLYIVPMAICLPFIWDIYHLGQPNLMLMALMLGTLVCLQRRKGWSAGALLALGTSIKAFPVLAVPYLVYRRQWKALASTIAFLFIFLVLLPAPIRGFQRNLHDMKTWSAGMIHYKPKAIAQRAHRGYSSKNQSLFAVANRLLRPIKSLRKTHPQYKGVNIVTIKFKYVNYIIIAFGMALCVYYYISTPPYKQRNFFSDSIEYSMLLLFIVMVSPFSFTYFFVWLLFPLMVAWNQVLSKSNTGKVCKVMFACFASAVLLLGFVLPISWFDKLRDMGCAFWACVILFVALGWRLRQIKFNFHKTQQV